MDFHVKAENAQRGHNEHAMTPYRAVPSVCPYCGCGCGIILEVTGEKVSGTLPLAGHPVSDGKLCFKGWSAHEFVHHPDRLTAPLLRKGKNLVEATWEEALQTVARGLRESQRRYGPQSVGGLCSAKCTNEENYLFQKLMRAALGTHNIDHCARLCHSPTVAGMTAAFGSGAMTNPIGELAEAQCILVVGSNVSENHPLAAARIYQAREKGARLIAVDPRHVQIADQADLYLRLRPGTDVALFNGMMHVILKHNLHNTSFIESRTEEFDALRDNILAFPPERVEEITGIPKNLIVEAARLYASSDRSAIVFCMGVTQHTTGTDNVMVLSNLSMLCGQIGREGTGVNPLRGQNNVQGACDMGGLPDVFPGYQPVQDPAIRKKFAEAWGAELPGEPGLTMMEMLAEAGRGIRAMVIMGENPVVSDPHAHHIEEALQALDFLAVLDIFPTETARLADVVLPSACFAEKDGTFTNTERRVQRIRRAVSPPGTACTDDTILCMIGGVLGYPMQYGCAEEIMEEIASLTPIYGGIKCSRLGRNGLQWPCPDKDHPGTPRLQVDRFTRGRGKFHPVEYRAPAEDPDENYPYILTTGRSFAQYHTGSMSRRSPSLAAELNQAYIEINPHDAASLGLKEHDEAEVASRRGSIRVSVQITPVVDPGVVFIPFHFAESAANVLTNPALDQVAKIPELKICAVRVCSAQGAGSGEDAR